MRLVEVRNSAGEIREELVAAGVLRADQRLHDDAGFVEAEQGRQRVAAIAEVAVDVVLEHEDLVFGGQLQ